MRPQGSGIRDQSSEKACWLRFVVSHPFAKCAKGWGTLLYWMVKLLKNLGCDTDTPGVLRATIYNSRPATALTTSRKKRLGVRSSAFVPRTSTLGLTPLS
jgi:hypothetical protein